MIYSSINNTYLTGSRLVLGTHLFGTKIEENTAFALLDAYLSAGGNILDTASVYADWLSEERHKSEKTIGKWLAHTGTKDLIITTKGGHHDLKTGTSRLFLREVREDLEKSFENLRTDRIDIYYLHKDDTAQEPEALMQLFQEAVSGFNVGCLGVSNWGYERIARANAYAKAHALKPIVASQLQHSIAKVNRSPADILVMDETELAKYRNSDLTVFAFSSQAKGLFSKLASKGAALLPQAHKDAFMNDYNLSLFGRLKKLSDEKGIDIATLALAALLNDSRLSVFPIIGSVSVKQLETSLQAATITLSADEQNFLLSGT